MRANRQLSVDVSQALKLNKEAHTQSSTHSMQKHRIASGNTMFTCILELVITDCLRGRQRCHVPVHRYQLLSETWQGHTNPRMDARMSRPPDRLRSDSQSLS